MAIISSSLGFIVGAGSWFGLFVCFLITGALIGWFKDGGAGGGGVLDVDGGAGGGGGLANTRGAGGGGGWDVDLGTGGGGGLVDDIENARVWDFGWFL